MTNKQTTIHHLKTLINPMGIKETKEEEEATTHPSAPNDAQSIQPVDYQDQSYIPVHRIIPLMMLRVYLIKIINCLKLMMLRVYRRSDGDRDSSLINNFG